MSEISKTVGITMGDPAGVGPEIIAKALAEMPVDQRRLTRVYGDIDMMRAAAGFVGADLVFSEERNPTDGSISVDHSPTPGGIAIGKLDPRAGDASFRYIASAVKSSQSNEIGCIVTAPINKEALNSAGHHYDGHTGMLAALTGSRSSFMLLADTRMSVIHVSTHVSLKDAIGRATTARVLETIRAGYNHFRRIGVENPRIAVAGINPHCGEHGLFGTEDEDNIAPAVELARAEGINAMGPISPDTVFYRCYSGVFDLVVAQYHDQGHIPMKLVGFDTTVNVSLGLPIDRTSVDHGTAFDIAGTGKANHVNMNAAIAYARKLAGTPRIVIQEAAQ